MPIFERDSRGWQVFNFIASLQPLFISPKRGESITMRAL